jgi:hypothetical protein
MEPNMSEQTLKYGAPLAEAAPPERTADVVPFPTNPPVGEVPAFLRKQKPILTVDIVIDADLPVITLSKALARSGLCLINTADGRLCVTHRPQEWRP